MTNTATGRLVRSEKGWMGVKNPVHSFLAFYLFLVVSVAFLAVEPHGSLQAQVQAPKTDAVQPEAKNAPPVPQQLPGSPIFTGNVPPEPTFKVIKPSTLKALPIPAQAIFIAASDVLTLPTYLRPYTRYVWVPSGLQEDFQIGALTFGHISRGSTILGPKHWVIVGKQLIRVNLLDLAPARQGQDLTEFVNVWEELQFDPMFSLLITKAMIRFLNPEATFVVTDRDWELVDKDKAFVENGKQVSGRWIRKLVTKTVVVKNLKDFDVLRTNGLHIPTEKFVQLQSETHSLAPVVSLEYFVTRALSTIKNNADGSASPLFKEIFGGLYYDFRGIKKGTSTKGTDLDVLLESLGIGSVEAGITFDKIFDRVRSDRRSAIFRSKVTARPRRIIWFQTPTGFIFITQDLKHGDIDIDQHPIMNLLDFKFAGSEVIFTTPIGLQGYSLFDGKGGLVDEVPADIAADRTIPGPHHPRLQNAISCMRCHNIPKDCLGMQPFGNDIQRMGKSGDFGVFGDLSQQNRLIIDTQDRIRGLYTGDPTITLMRARDDLAQSYLACTGPWKDGKDQTEIVRLATDHLASVYGKYNWDMVTPKQFLAELGYQVQDAQVRDAMWTLLPPDTGASDGVIVPEDPRILALKQGIDVNRADAALIYSFAAARVQRATEAINKVAPPAPKKVQPEAKNKAA